MAVVCVSVQSLPASAAGVEKVTGVTIYCPMKKAQLGNVKAIGVDPHHQAVWGYTTDTDGVQLVTTQWTTLRCPQCYRFKVKTNSAELAEWWRKLFLS